MAVLLPHHIPNMHPAKRMRRTATSVMAGDFDFRPTRDVLTCLLNGVPPYLEEEKEEEARKKKKEAKEEKKVRDKLRRREERAREKAEKAKKEVELRQQQQHSISAPPMASTSALPKPSHTTTAPASFWAARPYVHIATLHRSTSVTPPPITSPIAIPSSHESTPDPSNSSTTSRTSSKRPRTPDDDEDIISMPPTVPRPRKKRPAVRKGWKGWVEGSPPPSEKLINLDAVPVLQERRTRSGKNFDAIGVGKDGWV
ncbi:hypothetical protein Moror_15375 [Moniliophthora roreri MCA 2997]|uniref:Uncharacterized protein n=1 Tax=Moniliophthora roreri (strain MCA 2997) TaxID=1381753 RepID=V2X5Q1_MONRO|nr:hypothetical protein Moror_15375 [Moniliophthora roreri MCA 2997]